jgi:hypothetical protein
MDLAAKLQIKPGTVVCALAPPADGPDLSGLGPGGEPGQADAVIAFALRAADLTGETVLSAVEAAREDRLAWIAYPKGGQLGTDLNRDKLAAQLAGTGIQPVRQVALDDVWSALRFRPA